VADEDQGSHTDRHGDHEKDENGDLACGHSGIGLQVLGSGTSTLMLSNDICRASSTLWISSPTVAALLSMVISPDVGARRLDGGGRCRTPPPRIRQRQADTSPRPSTDWRFSRNAATEDSLA
jgi:hypothetical protein